MTKIHTVYEVRDCQGLVTVTSDAAEAQRESLAGRRVTAETVEVPV